MGLRRKVIHDILQLTEENIGDKFIELDIDHIFIEH